MSKQSSALVTTSLAALLGLFAPVPVARADIFQWEYINPADPSLGVQQSTTLCPDGAGAYAVSNGNLQSRDLTMASLAFADLRYANLTNTNLAQADLTYGLFAGGTLVNTNLSQANLTAAVFWGPLVSDRVPADLTGANLSHANLSAAFLHGARLTGANFTGAEVRWAWLGVTTDFTAAQLYSTASYQAHDLTGIASVANNLAGWNFAGQNLTKASLDGATLTGGNFAQANLRGASFFTATLSGATFTGADVRGAYLASTTGLTAAQLYSTASYQAHDLTGIFLGGNDLSGWNFAGQNLTSADFAFSDSTTPASLAGVNFTGANLTNANVHPTVAGANFANAEVRGAAFRDMTGTQLSTTASYQAHDLTGISLGTLVNGNFVGQNLTNARLGNVAGGNFSLANLTNTIFDSAPGANFTQTTLTNAIFQGDAWTADLTGADFTQAILTNARLPGARLSNARFTNAILANAQLSDATLTGADFTQANLTSANLQYAILTGAKFTGADVRGVNFFQATGMTLAQLYSTASYQAHDLTGINLNGRNLNGANFAGQNLTGASLNQTTLAGANLTGADVRGADLGQITGFAPAQLYSTGSYQAHDLTGIKLDGDLSAFNFAGQNLGNASIWGTLSGANLSGADVRGADFFRFGSGGMTVAQLYSTASYQAHDLTGIRLSFNDLSGVNFTAQNLTRANFQSTNLAGTDFSQADLTNATIVFPTAPGVNFSQANLTNALFSGADLTGAKFTQANLTNASISGVLDNADFTQANLTNAYVSGLLTGANLTGAEVRGAGFYDITLAQLYSTASYQAHDLTGVRLVEIPVNGNFVGQNLTNTRISSTLTGANLTGAVVRGALLVDISAAQLVSTASYQAHDLTGINLYGSNLAGLSLAGQNLTNSSFSLTNLTSADLSQANLTDATFFYDSPLAGANLTGADVRGVTFEVGIEQDQLYSTASYQAHDLSGIGLGRLVSKRWNFAGQNLTNASFNAILQTFWGESADLTQANFIGAIVTGVDFGRGEQYGSGISLPQLYSTASYQARDLSGINFTNNLLATAKFASQNLTNATFSYADLWGANLSGADTRGAQGLSLPAATTANMIWPDGTIQSLNLAAGERLAIRDYAGNPAQGLPANVVTVVGGMNIAATGQLDLGHSSLIVKNGNLASVTALLASGAAELAWNGPGIASSAAASDANLLTAVGVMLNDNGQGGPFYTTFAGLPVTKSDVLVKYTYYGDADLSGIVDGTDYALIDNGFNAILSGWFNGDFDYSGLIDGTDYALIDNAFNSQGAALGPSSIGPAVPEPSSWALAMLGMGLLGRVYRRAALARVTSGANV